ncbi:thiol reductant ABC exporter subunit CydD [Microbacterium sp. MYb72]|uniref:ABC transporter ATP-binding protein/permease n=1 Tax=Microbacterium sp. MYb72 TaxID=1848693 RepID=UPI000CFBDE10|nr:ABC transporter transmembrane domain-containing protein [Microbacterium sp. MYb72]PRB11710.1 thiol reductant ABC exporter subunit CydD [Microbacterium sp. MYb72]
MKPLDPRLLRYASAARVFVAASALIGVAQTAVTVAFAWMLTDAVTGAVAGRDVTASILWLLGLAGIRGLLIAASDAAGTRAAAATGAQLRAALISAVGRLGPGWLAQRNRASLAVTAGHGLEALDAYFARYIPQLVLTVIATPVLVAVMWWQDWLSGLTAIITLPLIPLFLVLIGMATRTVQRRQWQTLQTLAVRFADTVQGLSTLRLFGRDRRAADRIEATADDYRRETMKVLRFSFLSGFAMELLASLAVALIAVSIGFRLLAGDLSLEVGLFVLLLAPEAFLPIRQVGVQFHAAAEGVAATEDVFEVLDAAGAAGAGAAGAGAATAGASVAGASVVGAAVGARQNSGEPGAYAGGDPRPVHNSSQTWLDRRGDGPESGERAVLEELRTAAPAHLVVENLRVRDLAPVSFAAEPGTITLIEGPSGAGKSSLLAALRGAVPFDGSAAFGGADVRHLSPADWLAWSGQRPQLSRGTIAANVALGDREPDADGIRSALAAACAGALDPDRELGVQGSGLSGGQAQRVAVARALYRHARGAHRVLALDEPSSALDPDTEARLWTSLRERADAGATILLVSHRRSARDIADRVVDLGVDA